MILMLLLGEGMVVFSSLLDPDLRRLLLDAVASFLSKISSECAWLRVGAAESNVVPFIAIEVLFEGEQFEAISLTVIGLLAIAAVVGHGFSINQMDQFRTIGSIGILDNVSLSKVPVSNWNSRTRTSPKLANQLFLFSLSCLG